jgi:hypothetical protein
MGRRNPFMLRRIGIIAVLSLIIAAVAAVPALAVTPTDVTQSGGLHFVGTPHVTATKTNQAAFLTATGEVAGAGKTASAVLSATAHVTTGCINRGSQGQQPKGLKRSTTTATGSQTIHTRSGRGTFNFQTDPITTSRNCPDDMVPILVSVTFTNVKLTITSGPNKTLTATFPDIDP